MEDLELYGGCLLYIVPLIAIRPIIKTIFFTDHKKYRLYIYSPCMFSNLGTIFSRCKLSNLEKILGTYIKKGKVCIMEQNQST